MIGGSRVYIAGLPGKNVTHSAKAVSLVHSTAAEGLHGLFANPPSATTPK
jgi:hypothetical protein